MFYLKNDRHLKLLYGITVLIKKRTIICLSMFFHCLTKQELFGDTHVQIIYAFPPKVRFYSPSCFCHAIQIGRLLWYILRWWWQSLCQKPSIGRHVRSVSCVPFCCWFLWFYYILIRFNLFELAKLRLECHNQDFSLQL